MHRHTKRQNKRRKPIAGRSSSPLQLFKVKNSDEYDIGANGTCFKSTAFERGEELGRFTEETSSINPSGEISFKKCLYPELGSLETPSSSAKPKLAVSNNDKFAIENTKRKASQFFATPEETQQINRSLENVGSPASFTLDPSNSIVLPNGTEMFSATPLDEVMEGCSDCLETSQMLMGLTGDMTQVVIFLGTKHKFEFSTWLDSSLALKTISYMVEEPKVDLKQHLESSSPNLQETKELFHQDESPKFKSKAEELGINEYAQPVPGETYSILSPGWDLNEEKDIKTSEYEAWLKNKYSLFFNHGSIPNMEEFIRHQTQLSWNMHHATVFAKDHGDTLTMEGSNRMIVPYKEVVCAFERLWLEFDDFRQLAREYMRKSRQLEEIPSDFYAQQELFMEIFGHARKLEIENELLKKKIKTVSREFNLHFASQNLSQSMYNFRMYGSEDGSTFHDQWQENLKDGAITFRTGESLQLHKKELIDFAKNRWESTQRKLTVFRDPALPEWITLEQLTEKEKQACIDYINVEFERTPCLLTVKKLKEQLYECFNQGKIEIMRQLLSTLEIRPTLESTQQILHHLKEQKTMASQNNDSHKHQRFSWLERVCRILMERERSLLPTLK
ncbi:hypothetical protein [Aureibacter tunicatorum]|uniref:Uncharacterized protein n=1 Tax=Aureibacter tunicatorum TaxID=866807 RepID=A0AAE4BTB0_9BACT|nr:hypothetical protein [Aureibacter tunicatorum]MDR6239367.1 hypothetical protein [Aureibacter tunicatorum]BDD04710.1 hypothetical protein AUTU_21930 [Aureibacter tunicatorum]